MFDGTLYLKPGEIVALATSGFRALGHNVFDLELDCGACDSLDHGRAITAQACEVETADGAGWRQFNQAQVTAAVVKGLELAGFHLREPAPSRSSLNFYFDPSDGITANASVRIPMPTR